MTHKCVTKGQWAKYLAFTCHIPSFSWLYCVQCCVIKNRILPCANVPCSKIVAKYYINIWHSLLWRHNGGDGVSDHQPHDCLLNRLFRRRSKKTSKLRVNGLCAGNSPVTGEFPAQRASNAENVCIWWRHHVNVTRMCTNSAVVINSSKKD